MNTHLQNAAHTPGPWHRNIRANGKYPTIFAGRSTHVAVAKQMATPEETEANIDLIAAAPELLEALQRCMKALRQARGNIFEDAVGADDAARAAITKATGEQV